MRHFGHGLQEAQRRMMEVHLAGRTVAGIYPRDLAESKVARATAEARQADHPLLLTVEPVPAQLQDALAALLVKAAWARPGVLAPRAARELALGAGARWLRGFRAACAERLDRWMRVHGAGLLEDARPWAERVQLQTIHASKGRQADRVVVLGGWSRAALRNLETAYGGEHCLGFVAVTRTRDRVYLAQPSSGPGYPWPAARPPAPSREPVVLGEPGDVTVREQGIV